MGVKKFAISVDKHVMEQVDRAASERGVTRSRFITDVLRRVATSRTDAEITRRVNELFSDPQIADEQRETAQAFSRSVVASSEW